jgi:ABC-type sugar transport system permease subunit
MQDQSIKGSGSRQAVRWGMSGVGYERPYFAFLLNTPALLIIVLLAGYPIVYSAWISLHKFNLKRPRVFDFIGLSNYQQILESEEFWSALWITLAFTGLVVVFVVVLGLAIALLLNREFPGRNLVRTLILLPWAIPPVVNGLMWQWIYDSKVGALAYPAANISVLQLSVQPHLGPEHHFRIGHALAALRPEGVLIIGSGSFTHDLSEFRGHGPNDVAPDWVNSFADWFDGLALQVQETLKCDPHSGHLFVFRGRRGDLIKVLWHDGQGMCLFSKRLEKGKFLWPSVAEGGVAITPAQLGYLLEGIDWRAPRRT